MHLAGDHTLPELRLYFLGAPRIEIDGQPARTDRRKAVALLAYLATTGANHTREALATLFWPDADQSQAYAYMRRTIWEINDMLGKGWLVADRQDITLPLGEFCRLDVADFEVRLAEGRQTKNDRERMSILSEAVELYRDRFLAGFSLRDSPGFDEWQLLVGERLHGDLAWALQTLAQGYAQLGELEPAADYGRRWLALDPLHEPAYRQMMRIYALVGRRAEAIRQYERCVTILDEELGISPQPETTALYELIASGHWPDDARTTEGQPVKSTTPYRHLPVEPTPFVGRHDELATILDLLGDVNCRLLTLVGPGGSGKTRLSIQAASQLAERQNGLFPDGVCFISLAPLSSSESIVQALAGELNFTFLRDDDDRRRQLINYLRQKQMLLVMDNFEHLLDEYSAYLLSELIAGAPTVTILVTSRARLNVRGEQLFAVTGLKVPEEDNINKSPTLTELTGHYSALQLFLQRAKSIQSDFTLTSANIDAVVRICRLIEGMPLAIELAASWLTVLSPEEIAGEINRSLDFLQSDLRDVPERQKSIRAVFESSWRMLSDDEQAVLQSLSIFRGTFTYQAAQAICNASLTNLLSLANKSWLYREPGGGYRMHELLRQYALERLQEDPLAWGHGHDRHSAHYADFMKRQYDLMRGPDQKGAFERVEQAIENVLVAWLWLLEQKRPHILISKILPGFFYYLLLRFQGSEYQGLIKETRLAFSAFRDDPSRHQYWAIWQLYEVSWQYTTFFWGVRPKDELWRIWREVEPYLGDPDISLLYLLLLDQYSWNYDRELGIEHMRDFITTLRRQGDRWTVGLASALLGWQLTGANQNVAAREVADEALVIFEEIGDAYQTARSLHLLAHIGWAVGDYDDAEKNVNRAREIFETLSERIFMTEILYQLAEVHLQQGHFDQAFDLFQERRQMLEEMGQLGLLADGIHWDALHALRFGTLEQAREERLACLKLQRELDFKTGIAWSLWEMGEICRVEGDLKAARHWYDEAAVLFEVQHLEMGKAFFQRGLGDLALATGNYTAADLHFHEYLAWAAVVQNYWSVAYAYSGLGRASMGLGQLGRGRHYYLRSLKIAFDIGNRDLSMIPATGLASWLAATGDDERAVELSAFVIAQYLSWRETKAQARSVLDNAAGRLSIDAVRAAKSRAQKMEVQTVVETLLAERARSGDA